MRYSEELRVGCDLRVRVRANRNSLAQSLDCDQVLQACCAVPQMLQDPAALYAAGAGGQCCQFQVRYMGSHVELVRQDARPFHYRKENQRLAGTRPGPRPDRDVRSTSLVAAGIR